MSEIYYLCEKDPYKFDTDNNGQLALTSENVKRINFLIENDSNYRADSDEHNKWSAYGFIRSIRDTPDYRKNTTYDDVLNIVKLIDKQNSTHQSSEGRKGGNQGREITAHFIYDMGMESVYDRIEQGDPLLVNEIASAIQTRYTFSFASKFCTYMSRYMFDADEYSIYDAVLCDILPYYAWAYTENAHLQRAKKIGATFAKRDAGDYKGYRELIDGVRERAAEKTGYLIRREDFDHLLWYYYKGNSDLDYDGQRNKHNRRISEAMKMLDNLK